MRGQLAEFRPDWAVCHTGRQAAKPTSSVGGRRATPAGKENRGRTALLYLAAEKGRLVASHTGLASPVT